MQRFLCAIFLWAFSAAPVFALVTIQPEFPSEYDPHIIESDFYTKTTYLGELNGDPHLYRLIVEVGDVLPLRILQRPGSRQSALGLMVVEELGDGKGVREVARQNQPVDSWQREKNKKLGVTLIAANSLELALAPGEYTIEVSTPDNSGLYALEIGVDETAPGYVATLGAIRDVQSHFGYTITRMLGSSYVYWPLGIILLMIALYKLYRLHMRI